MKVQLVKLIRMVPRISYELGTDGYIRREGESKILGRVGGYGPGTGWYQLAAKPYDEPSVMGFADKRAAFEQAVTELEQRRKSHGLDHRRNSVPAVRLDHGAE